MTTSLVTTQSQSTTVVTLVKAGTLKNRLTKLNQNSQATTLSLAYYTMINGNVNPLANCNAQVATLLDPRYRHMVCAKFDKTKGAWVYAKAKSTKLLKELKLTFNDCTFEEFVAAVENHQATKLAKQADKEAQENALTPQEQEDAAKARVLKYLVNSDLSQEQLASLVTQVAIERSKKDAKSIKLATAGK